MEVKADIYNSLGVNEANSTWSCPSCNECVRSSEVDKHLELEIERLRQLRTNVNTTEPSGENGGSVQTTTTTATTTTTTDDAEHRKPWSIFRKVQRNRHSRLRRARKRPPPPTEQTCPVCNLTFPQEQIQEHADRCLRRTNGNSNANGIEGGDQASDDDNDGEEYEEYEWAGQKRIRVSSLLVGGYASIGIGQTISNGMQQNDDDDDDEDLNVDEDDTQIYGPAQYGESDVINATTIETHTTSEDSDVTNYMRHLITGHNPPPPSGTMHVHQSNHTTIIYDIPETGTSSSNDNVANNKEDGKTRQHYEQIIDSLKQRLRQYENSTQSKLKCLICLDDYRNPAISVSCWHVHCEECWLRSLGARKLCPQCNLITTPKDLRRIFM